MHNKMRGSNSHPFIDLVMLKAILSGLFISAALALAPAHGASVQPPGGWSAAWAAAPDSPGPALQAQTIRQVVRTSVAGSRVRIRLSNLFGTAPLAIGPVQLAAHAGGSQVKPESSQLLRFAGQSSVVIAPGASVLSDPVDMRVGALQDLAVSFYLPAGAAVSTLHGAGMQTAYLTAAGDATAAASIEAAQTDDSRYFLTDVEVLGAGVPATEPRALVVVGDSITDGIGSGNDRNARWTDALAARLQRTRDFGAVAVVNAGIAGNLMLKDAFKPFVGPSTLSRFERDALDKPGVRWILLHQGINDIAAATLLNNPAAQVSAEQVIAAMKTLAARARARGLKIWAGTLLPFEGTKRFYSDAAEAQRQAVNAWIRSNGGAFDAVVDFDQALRDPAHPGRLLPAFDSGDHLHPNAAGYQAMAGLIDLRLLP
jgi:lysophospholipase L1-like esterase